MAEHKRLTILKRLTELLEGINPAVDPDYAHNMVGRVTRGRPVIGDESPGDRLNIIEFPRPDFGTYAGDNEARITTWDLLITGYANTEDSPDHPTDPLYSLLHDVEERLAHVFATAEGTGLPLDPENYLLGETAQGQPLIFSLAPMPPVVRPASTEQSQARACFHLQIRIGLAE